MSLHPDLSDPSLNQAYEDVRDGKLNWVLYGYVPKTDKIRVDSSGNGGLSEMTDEMSDGKVHYGLIRYNLNGTLKFAYIAWCGEGVTGIRKGSFASHAVDMGKFLDGFHVQVNARNEDDLDETKILARLKTATSSHGRRNEKAKVQGSSGPDPTPKQPAPKRDVAADLKAESDAFWEKQRAEDADAKRRNEEAARNRNLPAPSAGNVGRAWEQKQREPQPAPQTRQAPVPSSGGAARIAAQFNNPPPAQAPPPKVSAPPPKVSAPPPKVEAPPPQPVYAEPEQHDDWGSSAPQEDTYQEEAPREEEPAYGGEEQSYGGGEDQSYGGEEEAASYGGGEDQSYGGGEEAASYGGGEDQSYGGGEEAAPAAGGGQCKALYTYQGENEGDLSFAEGDIINILDTSNPDGWWEGELNGVTGFFPSNFVTQL